jgi:hypothetical protein
VTRTLSVRRNRIPLAAAALLIGMGVAANATAQDRPTPLPELKRQRDRSRDAHHDLVVRISLLQQEIRKRSSELTQITKRVRALQSEPAGVLRDGQLKTLRREQNLVSRKLASTKVRLRAQEDGRKVRRLKLIQASWAYVARLLEIADRAWLTGRRGQARTHTDTALAELKRLEDLEALEDGPREEYPLADLDPNASISELREFKELYDALADAFIEQARELEPTEDRLKARVRHLHRLVQYSYAIPTLDERLKRAQTDLERVSTLRRSAEARASAYREQVEKIDALIGSRKLRRQQDGQRNGK